MDCTATYAIVRLRGSLPRIASANEIIGLKWAPLMGPRNAINVASAKTVAAVLASNTMARLPPANRSPMIPEPTTAAASSSEPSPSASNERPKRLGDFVGGGCLADSVQAFLQLDAIERANRKARKDLDPAVELTESSAESLPLVLL